MLLQLCSVRAAASGRFERLLPLADAWEEDRARNRRRSWLGVSLPCVESLEDRDRDLARALQPSAVVDRFDSSDWTRLVRVLGQRDPRTTDWGHVSTGLVESFVERGGARGGHYSTGSSLVGRYDSLARTHRGNRLRPGMWDGWVSGIGMEKTMPTRSPGSAVRKSTNGVGGLDSSTFCSKTPASSS